MEVQPPGSPLGVARWPLQSVGVTTRQKRNSYPAIRPSYCGAFQVSLTRSSPPAAARFVGAPRTGSRVSARVLADTASECAFPPLVLVTEDAEEVAALIRTERPHLVLLDLVLPGADGIELMASVPELADVPVIFISGYDRDETIAKALESGAADYIVKPFSPTELTARVGAVLRRQAESEPFVLGELSIDYEQRRVTVAGRTVRLTPIEFELLRALSLNAGKIMTYASLLRRVWGNGGEGGAEPVRDFVKKLRRKLGEDAARPRYIFNERGVGYRLAGPEKS